MLLLETVRPAVYGLTALPATRASLARQDSAEFELVAADNAARPAADALVRWEPPLVLAFGAASARPRWREALTDSGWRERVSFIFVA